MVGTAADLGGWTAALRDDVRHFEGRERHREDHRDRDEQRRSVQPASHPAMTPRGGVTVNRNYGDPSGRAGGGTNVFAIVRAVWRDEPSIASASA